MAHQVTLVRGDGTGPELAEATRMVLDSTGVEFDWDVQEAGIDVFEAEGTPLPDRVIDSIKRTKVALKAPITTPVGKGFRSVNVALRKMFELYACERPCKSYPGVRSRYENISLVVIRDRSMRNPGLEPPVTSPPEATSTSTNRSWPKSNDDSPLESSVTSKPSSHTAF